MSKYVIENTTLTSIADAVREKAGTTDLIKVSDLPTAIANIPTGGGGGEGIPEEAFNITGNCNYKFQDGGWDWFINLYGNQITTNNISGCANMFNITNTGAEDLEVIPFDFHLDPTAILGLSTSNMFSGRKKLTQIGDFYDWKLYSTNYMFQNCYKLRELPKFYNLDYSIIQAQKYQNISGMFNNCYSLRHINPDFIKHLYTVGTSAFYQIFSNGFQNCASLDEITGLPVAPGATITNNMFSSTFNGCCRLKDVIFDMNEDGTPKTASWKSQTIDLSVNYGGVGNYYDDATRKSYILNYNSGITADKCYNNDEDYQALKNDPDGTAASMKYSRYNHDSAVRTINSLPDCSAYLATAGGTNTIKFKGAAGSATDEGAINTLTEEEIAVAVSRGWTVTLV